MFRRLEDNPDDLVTISIEGELVDVVAGETVAAAMLASGYFHCRTTPVSRSPRAPFCMMGVCYDCMVVIDGQPNQRACRQRVQEGMVIEIQHGTGEVT